MVQCSPCQLIFSFLRLTHFGTGSLVYFNWHVQSHLRNMAQIIYPYPHEWMVIFSHFSCFINNVGMNRLLHAPLCLCPWFLRAHVTRHGSVGYAYWKCNLYYISVSSPYFSIRPTSKILPVIFHCFFFFNACC